MTRIRVASVCVVLLVSVLAVALGINAGTLDEIKASGQFIVGARDGAPPVGFIDEDGQWVGFSMDLAKEVHLLLEQFLDMDIELIFKPVTTKTRIPLVTTGTVHMVTGITGRSFLREETVDYTIQHLKVVSRLLVPKGSPIKEREDLAGMRLGFALGATHEQVFRAWIESGVISPPPIIFTYAQHVTGFLALQEGKIDAYCTDDMMLYTMRAQAPNPDDWDVVGGNILDDTVGFLVRENDSDFRDFANSALIKIIQTGKHDEIWDKWFGLEDPLAGFYFPISDTFRAILYGQTYLGWENWP